MPESLTISSAVNSMWYVSTASNVATKGDGSAAQADKDDDNEEQIWQFTAPTGGWTDVTDLTLSITATNDASATTLIVRIKADSTWTATDTVTTGTGGTMADDTATWTGSWGAVTTFQVGVKTGSVSRPMEPIEVDFLGLSIDGSTVVSSGVATLYYYENCLSRAI
jgi:hypothetical protein